MKSNFKNIFFLLVLIFCFQNTFAQKDSLRIKINSIINQAKADVGVALIGIENNDTLTFNDEIHYPMQSVFKFPLALKVLREVDNGKFSLDQKIHVKKSDLLPDTWSPLRKKYPDGNVDISLREILTLTVSLSDNNGCDILFRLLGGTDKVNKFVHDLGIKEMQIAANEEEMHKEWNVQFKNWALPSAMAQLLKKFAVDSILSKSSKDFLWDVMESTVTGSKRIKGQLPKGTKVAHKTGSSGTNNEGITAATNDIGIVTLPNGNHFVIVVFVSNSPADEKTRDKIISDISKAAWDYYLKK